MRKKIIRVKHHGYDTLWAFDKQFLLVQCMKLSVVEGSDVEEYHA
ncbi:MAG: hypothetical protein ACI8Z9_001028 [Paraglaciecola sp.]|jgi:hypothetical protein